MPLILTSPVNNGTEFVLSMTRSQTIKNEQERGSPSVLAEYIYSSKTNTQGNNAFINTTGSEYVQYYAFQRNNETTWKMSQDGFYMLSVYAITPYNTVIDTEITMELEINYPTYLQTRATLNSEVLISTNQDFANYINIQNFGTELVLKTIYDEATSPTAGYVYKDLTIREEIEGLEDNYTYVNFDVALTRGLTTYIMVYTTFYSLESGSVAIQKGTAQFYQCDTMIHGIGIIPTGGQEIIDMPGLMFYVITLPFTFISMAFNLTLFPGTPYQINISNLLLALIAILVFVFIMKLLISLAAKMGGA